MRSHLVYAKLLELRVSESDLTILQQQRDYPSNNRENNNNSKNSPKFSHFVPLLRIIGIAPVFERFKGIA